MSRNIKICAICGRSIYESDPKITSKPHNGKTMYAHIKCVYAPTKCKGGVTIGKKKESR